MEPDDWQERKRRAKEELSEAFYVLQRTLGEDHPATAATRDALVEANNM